MQWDKVKNILIVILLAVNLFLLGNLGIKVLQQEQRARALEDNLRTLIADCEMTVDPAFALPQDSVLPLLSLDRSRADEAAVAEAMLGEEISRTEREDGTVRYESGSGWLEWRPDGSLEGACGTGQPAPQTEKERKRRTASLLSKWMLWDETAGVTVSGSSATVTGKVAGVAVHNLRITLVFEETGGVSFSGMWSFGIPYTTAQENGVDCAAADALLAFAASGEAAKGRITAMQVGYRLQEDGGWRLQLVPTWRIDTDKGAYLVDCAKKMIISEEN